MPEVIEKKRECECNVYLIMLLPSNANMVSVVGSNSAIKRISNKIQIE